jgi:hypothetical protein
MIAHLKFHDLTGFGLPYVASLRLRSLVNGVRFLGAVFLLTFVRRHPVAMYSTYIAPPWAHPSP